MEQLGIVLRIQERRRLISIEAILLNQIRRGMRRGDIRICLTGSAPVPAKVGVCNAAPFSRLTVSRIGIQ